MIKNKNFSPLFWCLGAFILLACILRFWRIGANEFVFYDEGMYLADQRMLLSAIEDHHVSSLADWSKALNYLFQSAVATPKAVWFFLISLRVFIFGTEAWSFTRWISAFSGLVVIAVLFVFVRHYFGRLRLAVLSALILLILPSHVFYSRLGMQESLCTLFYMCAIFLYILSKRQFLRLFGVGILLTLTFWCNYRMIFAPLGIILYEIYQLMFLSPQQNQILWDVKQYPIPFMRRLKMWIRGQGDRCWQLAVPMVVFIVLVALVSQLYDGANYEVTFGWMVKQAQDASEKWDPLKILAFPINTFVLEGFFIAGFFWYGLRLMQKKLWSLAWPMILVLSQMIIFSMTADQGARYLCVVLPFFAITCAMSIDHLWEKYHQHRLSGLLKALIICSVITMVAMDTAIALNRSNYESAFRYIEKIDPEAKVMATQPRVVRLYAKNNTYVRPLPKTLAEMIELMKHGYYYLIVDPQAYVEWGDGDIKFNENLLPFLKDIVSTKPIYVIDHWNFIVHMRFILDHNEHMKDTWSHIRREFGQQSHIHIYDLREAIKQLISRSKT